MNINAKQLASIDYHGRMDLTTVLSFWGQIVAIVMANEAPNSAER